MELSSIIQTGSLLGFLLVVVVYGGYKGWWYFGPQVEKQLSERDAQIATLVKSSDEWKQLAMSGLIATRQAADNQAQIAATIHAVLGDKKGG